MANEIQIKFNSFTLDDGGTYLVDSFKADESKAIHLHKIPGSQESRAEDGERESIVFKMSGSISSTNYDALRTAFDALKAALHDGIQKFTLDDDRYIMAQISSFGYEYKHLRTLLLWEATFVAHYPYWLAETPTVSDTTPTSGVGYTITNNGNSKARVKVEITPSATMTDACKVENQTNGESFQYRGTVAAGDVLEVDNHYDTDDHQVLNDGADGIVNFEGDFLELEPGANTIVFTGTATTAVKITCRDTYAA
jgi:phage-related protein